QPSVSVADPSAAVISVGKGLHPSVTLVYVPVNTGGVRSDVQLTVLEVVALLPQASRAVNVLTCVTIQPAVVGVASLDDIVGVPQPSVAVALPNAAVISVGKGLHPSVTGEYVPVNTGGVRSEVQLTVLVVVALLPQASRAVNVLTCVTIQPAVVGVASLDDIVGLPQPSVAVADPSAAVISVGKGLHPSVTLVYVPVNTGGVRSDVQLTVLEVVALLPHASRAVNVLTCVTIQPAVVGVASLDDIVGVPQPSVAVALPNAA